MDFKSIMHISFYTGRMEEMHRFYTEVLGGEVKVITRAKAYADRPGSYYYEEAIRSPEKIIIMYIELAPGQFIELFPENPGQLPHRTFNDSVDYSHFSLLCDDIFATRELLEGRGLVFDTEPSKGPSGTWQMWAHDPDGNMFEVMQYTQDSYQVVGHIDE